MIPRFFPRSLPPPTLSIVVLLIAGPAHADLYASGRAFGSHSTLFGATLALLTTADTETRHAAAKGTFSGIADGASIAVPSLAEIASGSSTTSGSTAGHDAVASSVAGDSAARLFPVGGGGPDALDVASTGASARLDCQNATLTSGLDSATLLGTALLELDLPPNTTILSPAPGLDLLTLNRQRLTVDPRSGSIVASVEAVRADLMVGDDALTLSLSGATASLRGLPPTCPVLRTPSFTNSTALVSFVTDSGTPSRVDGGDRLRFTVRAENSGGAAAHAVSVVDRLPANVHADVSSVRVGGSTTAATLSPCPPEHAFRGCAREAESDAGRECLTIELGDLAAASHREIAFDATASDAHDVCNSALVTGHGQEAAAIVLGAGGESTMRAEPAAPSPGLAPSASAPGEAKATSLPAGAA